MQQEARAQHKLNVIMRHAPTGLAEIDKTGTILQLNERGESCLHPIFIATGIPNDNMYAVLGHIAPGILNRIEESADDAGEIVTGEIVKFHLSFGGETVERHFNFTVIKLYTDSIVLVFDDVTRSHQALHAIQELHADKAVMKGKFEIASNILHDIGNAVVGFGSYMNRIRRSLEQQSTTNIEKLATFFSAQQTAMAGVLGEAKAGAITDMLSNIAEGQKKATAEMAKSLTEQHHIITHIQDILHIQRQYVNGNDALERKSVKLRHVVDDCMSMLYASIEKRAINVTLAIPEQLPDIIGDRTRLMQVLLNIIKNSVEAIDINAIEKKISITAHVSDEELMLQVKDNGHGFDEPTGRQLFRRGFTTKASGSGLGLDHCRMIIENHGGSIDLDSEGFGKGSVATIRFTTKTSKPVIV